MEDRPGVTRGKQWVSLGDGVELLDMPGVLWPKFEDKLVGERLAFIGSIKDDILDIEHLAMRFLAGYGGDLSCADRRPLQHLPGGDGGKGRYDLLELVGPQAGGCSSPAAW